LRSGIPGFDDEMIIRVHFLLINQLPEPLGFVDSYFILALTTTAFVLNEDVLSIEYVVR
jgi:hypothetical protein